MILRVVGRLFIGAGMLILLFLAYQLWGTNLVAERHQRELAAGLDEALFAPVDPDATPPPLELGDGIARIQMPKIEVDWIVVEGVSVSQLKKGPGHYPGTAYPGEKGNVVVSGHRTTYGAPFFRLDELKVGDTIRLVARNGTFSYKITESKIVAPTDLTVVVPSDDSRLTLTTCHPRFSARQRLIVVASLVEEPKRAFE